MVVGEVASAAAGGTVAAHALWGYNRENFKYDREMRQEQEFQIFEYRNKQVEQWREDVRDLIGLTEKKMDLYAVPTTIQLGMCVVLFSEGRLEPGTPQWLLRMYMLTLGGAFMYLLMAVWLAMHASVVAQSSSARLLTQLVRLPVPSWDQIEAVRTYAASYESLGLRHMLRIPFLQRPEVPGGDLPPEASTARPSFEPKQAGRPAGDARGGGRSSDLLGTSIGSAASADSAVDPWGLERDGGDIYELQQQPTAVLRHVDLVRRASAHYQCYDAFARVAMTMGTNQLLFAISYYALGYLIVQDGAPWPGWCVVLVMVSVAATLVQMDLSLTRSEQMIAQVLIVAGPAFASFAATVQSMYTTQGMAAASYIIPLVFASQGLWLLWVLNACNVQEQPNGAALPTKFRTVLYLDVFGWLFRKKREERGARGAQHAAAEARSFRLRETAGTEEHARQQSAQKRSSVSPGRPLGGPPPVPQAPTQNGFSAGGCEIAKLGEELALWEAVVDRGLLDEVDRQRVSRMAGRFRAAMGEALMRLPQVRPSTLPNRSLKLYRYTDFGTEVPYIYDVASSAVVETDVEYSFAGALELSATERRLEAHCARQLQAEPSKPPKSVRFSQQAQERSEAPGDLLELGALPERERAPPMPRFLLGPRGARGSTDGIQDAHRSSMAFPQHFDTLDGRPVRPEDIDRYHAKAVHEAAHTFLLDEMERDPHRHTAVQGVGNAAAVPHAHHDAFNPVSFYPQGRKLASDRHIGEEDAVVTGHDREPPGTVPWKIFRLATKMLVTCWVLSCALSVPLINDIVGIHTKPLPEIMEKYFGEEAAESAAMGVDLVDSSAYGVPGNPGKKALEHGEGRALLRQLQELPGGEQVQTTWPAHFSFVPRALSSDASGRRLVVADDFGVFSAETTEAAGQGERRLSEEAPAVVRKANFRREPACLSLEGQALRDVALVCAAGDQACSVLSLLQGRGRLVAQCPLSLKHQAGRELAEQPQAGVAVGTVWEIAGGWMNASQEQVEALATVHACAEDGSRLADSAGCVLVGTSAGRVVQLRQHKDGQGKLVPDWALQHAGGGPGEMHALPGGRAVLALWPRRGTLQALDTLEGVKVAEWRLPQDTAWSAVAGGSDCLFLLGTPRRGSGRSAKRGTSLWRFPLPEELQALVQSGQPDTDVQHARQEM